MGAARELLTLEEKDPRRLFEGNALLRRLVRIGVLDEDHMKLDFVLGLKVEDFLERRLQTQVFKLGLLVINGQKMWITNAFQADWMCLLANTQEGPVHLNKSLICLPPSLSIVALICSLPGVM